MYSKEPPSDEEREWYFHGLGGGQLVARTNSQPEGTWKVPIEYDDLQYNPHVIRKQYGAVGVHASDYSRPEYIREVRAALPRIQQELDSHDIDWTWFTGVRIGLCPEWDEINVLDFDLEKHFPVVILVHVTPKSTSFRDGSRVAWAIQAILDRRNLSSVRVEMREGAVVPHPMPTKLDVHGLVSEFFMREEDLKTLWKPTYEERFIQPWELACIPDVPYGLDDPLGNTFPHARINHMANGGFFKLQNTTSEAGRLINLEHGDGPGALRVVKRGMKSGVTIGITNGIEACVRWNKSAGQSAGQENLEKSTEKAGGASEQSRRSSSHSWELIVIPFSARDGHFSVPGDSGASVVEKNGKVVGLVVGGGQSGQAYKQQWPGYQNPEASTEEKLPPHGPLARTKRNEETGETEETLYFDGIWLSFVTPIDLVFQHLKRVTGHEPVVI